MREKRTQSGGGNERGASTTDGGYSATSELQCGGYLGRRKDDELATTNDQRGSRRREE